MTRSKKISFAVSREVYEALAILAAAGGTTVSNTVRLMVWKDLIDCELLDLGDPLTEAAAKSSPYRVGLAGITGEAA